MAVYTFTYLPNTSWIHLLVLMYNAWNFEAITIILNICSTYINNSRVYKKMPFNISDNLLKDAYICQKKGLKILSQNMLNFGLGAKFPLKGVLHPRLVFGLFLHFSQKLQHIGNK